MSPLEDGRIPLNVALGLVEDAGRWLVSLRAQGRIFAGMWEFPGGKIAEGEAPEEAVVREVREEAGLTVEPVNRLGEVRTRHGGREVTLHVVRCRLLSGEARPADPAVEEVRWVPLHELRRLPMPPANEQVLKLLDVPG